MRVDMRSINTQDGKIPARPHKNLKRYTISARLYVPLIWTKQAIPIRYRNWMISRYIILTFVWKYDIECNIFSLTPNRNITRNLIYSIYCNVWGFELQHAKNKRIRLTSQYACIAKWGMSPMVIHRTHAQMKRDPNGTSIHSYLWCVH